MFDHYIDNENDLSCYQYGKKTIKFHLFLHLSTQKTNPSIDLTSKL